MKFWNFQTPLSPHGDIQQPNFIPHPSWNAMLEGDTYAVAGNRLA